MKEDQINLVTKSTPDKKVTKIIKTPSFMIFAVVFIIGFILLSFSLALRLNLSSLDYQERQINTQISGVAPKKNKMLILSERVASIRKIIAKRATLGSDISLILSGISGDFSVDSITTSTLGTSFTLSSDSLVDFATLLTSSVPVIVKNKNLGISTVTIDTFDRSTSGYTMSLTFSKTATVNK